MLKDGQYAPSGEPDGFPSRLREALDSYGSTTAAAKAIGFSEGAVRKWLRGESQPNVTALRAICDLTGANVEWLVTGRGTRDGRTGSSIGPGGSYGSGNREELGALDFKLMDETAVAVKLEPRINGVAVTPEKCASILTVVYNMSRQTRHVDVEAAERVAGLPS